MLKRILCFSLLIFSTYLVAATKPATQIKLKNLSISYNEIDKKVGAHIGDLLVQLRRDKLKKDTLDQLYFLSKKSRLFKSFEPAIKKAYNLKPLLNKSFIFSNSCSLESLTQSNAIENISKRIEKRVAGYCRLQFLKTIKQRKNLSAPFIGFDLNFLHYATPFYLRGESRKEFLSFIEVVDKNSALMKQIVSLITESYKENEIDPSSKLMTLLPINSQLTQYIQSSGLNDKEARKFFTREFNSIYREFSNLYKLSKTDEAYSKIRQLISFYHENNQFISQDRAWRLIVSGGKKFLHDGLRKEALFVLKESHRIAKHSQKQESIFQLMWTHLIHKDYEKAIEIIEQYSLIENFNDYNSKVQYWIAKSLHQNNEHTLAKHLYKKLTKISPLSFYAIISTRELEEITKEKVSLIPPKRSPSSIFNIPQSNYKEPFINSLSRLLLWLSTDFDRLAYIELNQLSKMNKEDVFDKEALLEVHQFEYKKFITMEIIDLLHKHDKYLHTFKLVHNSLDKELFEVDTKILRYLFPFPYHSKIERIDNSIDPLVVLSLIRQESAFNPYARSSAGARGLMQLLPSTARSLNKRVKGYHLKKPSINIKIGIKYLRKLLKKYDGNLIFTLAAYNAGQTKVDRWRKNIFKTDDPLMLIESIPYSETRKYVKLIYRNMHFYRLLADKEIDASLEDSFKVVMTDFKR